MNWVSYQLSTLSKEIKDFMYAYDVQSGDYKTASQKVVMLDFAGGRWVYNLNADNVVKALVCVDSALSLAERKCLPTESTPRNVKPSEIASQVRTATTALRTQRTLSQVAQSDITTWINSYYQKPDWQGGPITETYRDQSIKNNISYLEDYRSRLDTLINRLDLTQSRLEEAETVSL